MILHFVLPMVQLEEFLRDGPRAEPGADVTVMPAEPEY